MPEPVRVQQHAALLAAPHHDLDLALQDGDLVVRMARFRHPQGPSICPDGNR